MVSSTMYAPLYAAFFLGYLVVFRSLTWLAWCFFPPWNKPMWNLFLVSFAVFAMVVLPMYFYHRETGIGALRALLYFQLPAWSLCLVLDLSARRALP